MDINYIIVQAGGKGTRLGFLTENRPKAIVPVNNRPVIFHLFERFPKAKFIIIGDYKFDVMRVYLEAFANVSYILIHTQGEGNACGVKKALQYVPENNPVMILWSDLLLDRDLHFNELNSKCYLGITDKFKCSWKYENAILEKVSTEKNGVAGLFIFDDKSQLKDVPEAGSFTRWLSGSDLEYEGLNLLNSCETGSVEAIKRVDHSNQNRCRPYNKMTFLNDRVIKEGLTEEGKELIKREVLWYMTVSKYQFDGIPYIYSYDPLEMSRVDGDNIFRGNFTDEQKRHIIDQLVENLNILHQLEKGPVDAFDMQEDYYTKTLKRVRTIRNVIPFNNQPYIKINGVDCKNIFFHENTFQKMVDVLICGSTEFGIIHGDGTLTNTLIDNSGNIYFIDARGYFGKTPLIGDVYYDWAKLYYSIEGAFDQFNVKNFELHVSEDGIEYCIKSSGWEKFTQYFIQKIPDCNVFRIKMIHVIIWLSLASHCWEDYDSMCLAFYNGIYLWNELMQERI